MKGIQYDLPEEFELVDFSEIIYSAFTHLYFFYKNRDARLNITYKKYNDSENQTVDNISSTVSETQSIVPYVDWIIINYLLSYSKAKRQLR